jgi:hypothetical protein
MLQRSGGKMKEPPYDPEGKKRGGVIKKRRYAGGGEVDDKEAGLAASNKEEPVGFFKRLMMGNIDQPGSEAYEKFGAGRGKSVRESAAEMARESGRTAERYKPVVVEAEKPVDLRNQPDEGSSNVGIASIPTGPSRYKRDTEGEAASELARELRRTTPTNAPVRRTNPSISSSDKPMSPVGAMGKPRDVENEDWKATAKAAQENEARDDAIFKARAKASQDAAKPVKRPGIIQRMRDKDKAIQKAGEAKRRQDSGDFGTLLPLKKGGAIKKYASGGSVSSRADGCAQRGKTRGMMR